MRAPPAPSRTLEPTEHQPDCTKPGMLYQARLRPGGPILGHCPSCGASTVHRPTTTGNRKAVTATKGTTSR